MRLPFKTCSCQFLWWKRERQNVVGRCASLWSILSIFALLRLSTKPFPENDVSLQQWRYCCGNQKYHSMYSSAREKFTAHVNCNVDWSTNCLELMTYILDRYDNMSGTYFVCHIKGNVGRNHAIQWAKKHATRSIVATAVYYAKISGRAIENDDDNKSEDIKQLWDSAASPAVLLKQLMMDLIQTIMITENH